MQMTDYLIQSGRTAAGKFFGNLVAPFEALIHLRMFAARGEGLDGVKKALFYGKTQAEHQLLLDDYWDSNIDTDILHAILGVATESSELVELLTKALETGDPMSRQKLMDESGDVLWYLALLFRKIDTNFEEVMALNLKKLMTRFPEKFEAALALGKDDAEEAKVFE